MFISTCANMVITNVQLYMCEYGNYECSLVHVQIW